MAWLLPPLIPHFGAALRDVTAQAMEARERAAQRLGMASDEEREQALEALETLSADPYPQVRATAIAGLGELASETSLDALVARVDDPSAEVRELAIVALGRIGGARARDILRAALGHAAAEVRFQAVAALAELDPAHAVDDLLALIDDEDAQVRAQVAEALGRLAVPHTLGHLARLLHDDVQAVRLQAAIAYAQHGDARGEPELVAALERRERTHEVCLALGRVAQDAGRAALADLAERRLAPAQLRAAAGAALLQRGDGRGTAALRRVLRGLSATARGYAVELIGSTGGTALLPELARLCERPRGTERLTLAEALVQLGDAGGDVDTAFQTLVDRGGDDEASRLARGWLAGRQGVRRPSP